jgi:hypothetical protein
MFQGIKEAAMGPAGWTRVLLMPVGTIIGAVVGHLITPPLIGILIGAASGAAAMGLLTILPPEIFELFSGLTELIECCPSVGILFLASIVTRRELFLWQSSLRVEIWMEYTSRNGRCLYYSLDSPSLGSLSFPHHSGWHHREYIEEGFELLDCRAPILDEKTLISKGLVTKSPVRLSWGEGR